MPDNKHKRGRQDRAQAARLQAYEVYYIAHKFAVAPAKVRDVIRRVGNSRKAIYGVLLLLTER